MMAFNSSRLETITLINTSGEPKSVVFDVMNRFCLSADDPTIHGCAYHHKPQHPDAKLLIDMLKFVEMD